MKSGRCVLRCLVDFAGGKNKVPPSLAPPPIFAYALHTLRGRRRRLPRKGRRRFGFKLRCHHVHLLARPGARRRHPQLQQPVQEEVLLFKAFESCLVPVCFKA